MVYALLISLLLILVTFYVHFFIIKMLSRAVPQINISNHHQVLLIVLALFMAHILEASIYAVAYDISISCLNLGSLQGATISTFMEYLYYSIVMYTSLGLGEVYPLGHVRFITGLEALNGLLLISWSASFTFLVMKRIWPWNQDDAKHN